MTIYCWLSMCQALCWPFTQLSYLLYVYPFEMATSDPILQKRMPGLIVVEYLEQLTLETTFVQLWSQCFFHFTSSIWLQTSNTSLSR